MAGKLGITFLDTSGELSRVDIYTPDVTAGNIAAILDDANPAHAGSLAEAVAALSLCTAHSHDVLAVKAIDSSTPPVSQYAQRELGLMVTYSDNVTGRIYHVTIPGPDWTNLGQAGTDMVLTSAAAWTAFVTLFNSVARSQDGNAVTVMSGRLVGRNR